MAKMPDGETGIWSLLAELRRLREEYKTLFAEFAAYQHMLAALAARHGGVLVFDPGDLAEVPPGYSFVASKAADGRFVVRLVTGGQPGSDR